MTLLEKEATRLESILADLKPGATLTTREVAEALWGDLAKLNYARLMEKQTIEQFRRCWTRGKAIRGRFGQLQRPYIWHAPNRVCPCCSGTGYLAWNRVISAEEVSAVLGNEILPEREPTPLEIAQAKLAALETAVGQPLAQDDTDADTWSV